MIAQDTSDRNNKGFLEELLISVSTSTNDLKSIKTNFDTIFSSAYDKMQDYDKNYVFGLAESFYNMVEELPDYRYLYEMVTEIEPDSTALRASDEAIAVIEICREHDVKFKEYLEIQDVLMKLYSSSK